MSDAFKGTALRKMSTWELYPYVQKQHCVDHFHVSMTVRKENVHDNNVIKQNHIHDYDTGSAAKNA